MKRDDAVSLVDTNIISIQESEGNFVITLNEDMGKGSKINLWAGDLVLNAEKAFGGCKKCYGKGYSTYRYGLYGAPDFDGEGYTDMPQTHILYCSCERGVQLEELFGKKEGLRFT